jgi:cytoplasmic tRNA 2-thiolation protein 1
VVKVKHFSEIKVEEAELKPIKPRDPAEVYTPPPRVPGGILHDANLDKKDITW